MNLQTAIQFYKANPHMFEKTPYQEEFEIQLLAILSNEGIDWVSQELFNVAHDIASDINAGCSVSFTSAQRVLVVEEYGLIDDFINVIKEATSEANNAYENALNWLSGE